MSKKQETALNIYTWIVLNLIFWICGNTPRRIINFNDVGSLASYILHLLYFALFAFFALIAFSRDKTVFSEKVFDKKLPFAKRWELGKWIALLLLQIGFDCAAALLSSIGARWKYIGTDILIPLYWLILFFICTGKRHLKKENTRIFIFEISFILLLTLGSVSMTEHMIADYIAWIPKYQSGSPVLSAVGSNADFLYGIKLALYDTAIGSSLLIMNRLLMKDESKVGRCSFTAFSLRMTVTAAALLMCIVPKAIYPDGLLSGFGMHDSDHTSYQYFEEVRETGGTLTVYRLSSERKATPCYQKDRVTLSVDGKVSADLTRSYIGKLYPYYVKDNALDEVFFLYPVLSEETEVYIYDSQVICFYENEAPRMIRMDAIKDCEENEILTSVCKELLSQGNIYIFEYAAEYLKRCEPDFATEYAERYASGNFTEAELLWMQTNDYRESYVIGIAGQYFE